MDGFRDRPRLCSSALLFHLCAPNHYLDTATRRPSQHCSTAASRFRHSGEARAEIRLPSPAIDEHNPDILHCTTQRLLSSSPASRDHHRVPLGRRARAFSRARCVYRSLQQIRPSLRTVSADPLPTLWQACGQGAPPGGVATPLQWSATALWQRCRRQGKIPFEARITPAAWTAGDGDRDGFPVVPWGL